MKKSKTSLIIVLMLCMALTLSACTGGKASGADTSGNNSTTENTSAEESSVSETTAELIDTSDKTIMTIDVPADTPVADRNGEIPGADAVSDIVRQTVIFGSYYQDSAGAELTPVEWIVLDEQDGYTLLMTKPIIASMGWVNEGRNDITWAETDLRRWLDNEFYNTAFSEEERENMALFRATQPQNPRYDTPAGEETIDTVSLLSYQELIKYMPTDLERKTKPTDYAAQQGCYLNPDGDSAWWLRSPGPTATVPEHLASWGNLGARTHYIDDYSIGVRPAIWVDSEYLASVKNPSGGSKRIEISFDFTRMSTQATNQIAIWVEDASGQIIKNIYISDFTAKRRGYERREDALMHWVTAKNPAMLSDSELDAISSATLQSGAHSFIWDLTDDTGRPCPDGKYTINLEGTLYWSSNILFTGEIDLPGVSPGEIDVQTNRSEPDHSENDNMIQNVRMTACD